MKDNGMIYICSPYRGEVKRNKEYARELTRKAIDNGFVPVTVHLYLTEALDDNKPDERAKGMEAGQTILDNCKFILVGGRYGISEGMASEIKRAMENGTIILCEGEPGKLTADCNTSILKRYIEKYEKERAEKAMSFTNWDELSEVDKFKHTFKTIIQRDGARNLLEWLDEVGFYEAPASTKYHGAYPGGLVEHSNNVYRRLVMLAAGEDKRLKHTTPEYSEETLAIVALLHDVCKVGVYHPEEKDGKQQYSFKDGFPYGHGEKSVLYIMRHIYLTEEEALAIRWHMGLFDKAAQGDFRDMDKAFKQSKLAAMLHLADMMATHLDEREVGGGA